MKAQAARAIGTVATKLETNIQAETQARLEGILGTQNIQYAFLIHKLLMLEDSLY